MNISEILVVREWLFDNNLDFTEDEFDDLLIRIETNNTPPKKGLKLHKPTLDVLDLEAEFLSSNGPEPQQIAAADSEENALIIARFFCRENHLDPSGDVLLLCVRRLREQL